MSGTTDHDAAEWAITMAGTRSVRYERHRDALGDRARTPVRRARPNAGPESSLPAGVDPAAQRRPRGGLAVTAHLAPNVRDAATASEAKKRQRDGHRAEVPAAQHTPRHHDEHRPAATAPVPANGHHPHRGRRTDRGRAANLPQAQAVTHDPERPA
jgi:hypothetical protein